MFLLGLQAAAWRVPFLPTRVGLGSDLFRDNPGLRTVRRRTRPDGGDEELVAAPALHLDAALVHLNRADARGNAGYLGPDLYFDDLFVGAADKAFVSAEYVVPTDDLEPTVGLTRLLISRLQVDGVVEAHRRRPLHQLRARLRARRGVPEGVRRVGQVARGVGRVQGGVARPVARPSTRRSGAGAS